MEPMSVLFDRILGTDDNEREGAYLKAIDRPPSSLEIYPEWSRLEEMLVHKNNHVRSIGGKLFSFVASGDPEGRIWSLWESWKAVASDKMFVTARHTIQASPRFATAGPMHRRKLIEYYADRFRSCSAEKNTSLIRYDIQVCLREVYNQYPDPLVSSLARDLIAEESDPKYQAKYKTAWKNVSA